MFHKKKMKNTFQYYIAFLKVRVTTRIIVVKISILLS